ncbi:MAG TPA: extensin family protein [Allosphingosinicella sp.]|nr:extensin family protein [Allosphingosinicella sp.]
MAALRFLKILIALALAGFAGLLLYGYARNHPQDLPWTPLDLTQPVGAFTGRKLAGLGGEGEQCRTLLSMAGVRFTPLPPRSAGPQCGYDDAVRFRPGGALGIGYKPPDLGTSCSVAAALALWEWHVVQPAALKHFGLRVEAIDHFGSFSCRRIYGRSEGAWSEHATANAVDIAGFRLEDGTRISVLNDWEAGGAKAAFLREVRSGACDLFATVLSPDYNEAHRDHLHFDQAQRGAMGWRGCR